jgi:predicted alpha/beta-fold hydrolase
MALTAGCFQEKSFPLRMDQVEILGPGGAGSMSRNASTRSWLVETHDRLEHFLPREKHGALLTDDLTDAKGQALDVFAHFEEKPESLGKVIPNLRAYLNTAQSVSSGDSIDNPPAPWDHFAKIWVPVAPDVEVSAFLGLAREGDRVKQADCIVVLAGMLGDNETLRTRDLSVGLRSAGFHVLALEMRGQGQTEAVYPEVPHCYGVLETVDLLKLSEWLTDLPHVRRTGLIGFSWGANMAVLVSWLDGCGMVHPNIKPPIKRHLEAVRDRSHYSAGIMACSPVLDWETLMDQLDEPISFTQDPTRSFVQNTVRNRAKRKGYSGIGGNLRLLIDQEFNHSVFTDDFPTPDRYEFLRLRPYRDFLAGDKLEHARVPTLIVHGADDPLASAQNIADLIATTKNPNVAAVILPGGGHVGFAPYSSRYFYSLMVNFFRRESAPDPSAAAQAVQQAMGDRRESLFQ